MFEKMKISVFIDTIEKLEVQGLNKVSVTGDTILFKEGYTLTIKGLDAENKVQFILTDIYTNISAESSILLFEARSNKMVSTLSSLIDTAQKSNQYLMKDLYKNINRIIGEVFNVNESEIMYDVGDYYTISLGEGYELSYQSKLNRHMNVSLKHKISGTDLQSTFRIKDFTPDLLAQTLVFYSHIINHTK